ncbi:PPC domain-containing DNA-binding protein [Rhizobium sp. LCM 4573]|uniref:PPC domain-containing DNA-binding protein n=1 Tax=Rhizobium sp. LCM 4573 TaxID=1848291 RepID=UPI0008D97D31|nr:PPC domain-containing DNA-binding protein [Rhizobium sp. LCM 4573]OHV81728.1 DNA-binding protein with PD1-like DNA-binding motif [Rhizobium sp. LCM 4573]
MQQKLLSADSGERTFIVVMDEGDEAFSQLASFAKENSVTAASVSAIGAFKTATIAFFDYATKSYQNIPVQQQSEVLSLIGDIAQDDEGNASLHMHAVLGFSDGSTKGGHFVEGTVRPTLEIVVRETPANLKRRKRQDLGLALIDLGT